MKKVSYALGVSMAGNMKKNGLGEIDVNSFADGVRDALNGSPKVSIEEAQQEINNFFNKLRMSQMDANKAEGEKFLSKNKNAEGVKVTKSGLQYKIITAGSGNKPKATDTVKCHYEGRLINGEIFDSSYRRGEPTEFPVNGVIPGWVEALQMMPVGSKWQVYVPSDLAYGEYGAGDSIEPNSTLIFDIELLDIL